MNFFEWVLEEYPKQFIPTEHLLMLRKAWDAGQKAEREKMQEEKT